MQQVSEGVVQTDHESLGRYYFYANTSPAPIGPRRRKDQHETVFVEDTVTPDLLFTDNDTNLKRLYDVENKVPYTKDAFHDHIIPSHRPAMPTKAAAAEGEGEDESAEATPAAVSEEDEEDTRQFVNPEKRGTKTGAHYTFNDVPGNGGCAVVRLKLTTRTAEEDPSILDEESFDMVMEERRMDSDEFYSRFNSGALSDDLRNVMRQALSGMLWCVSLWIGLLYDNGELTPLLRHTGRSNSTCSSRRSGSRATPVSRLPRRSASSFAIASGSTCTSRTSCRCPTSGSTRSLPSGTRYVLLGTSALASNEASSSPFRARSTGIPLHPARHDRPGIRQETARHHDPRVVHEAGRRASRVRVELR